MMQEELKALEEEALQKVKEVTDERTLQDIRVHYLGKKGALTAILRGMGKLSKEERPIVGEVANIVRENVTAALDSKKVKLEKAALEAQLEKEKIDVTGPHILTQIIEEIEDLFIGMGYEIKEGPEVETDYFNFEALNLPKNHPARDMQDTFYLTNELLLRTHTSPMQARTMQNSDKSQPVKMICPGKVYRRDTDDATHSHQFTQIEGLYVDRNVTMSDLKGTLDRFSKAMFG